jgi:putative exosortase-associated protein (TIGR04073 family)
MIAMERMREYPRLAYPSLILDKSEKIVVNFFCRLIPARGQGTGIIQLTSHLIRASVESGLIYSIHLSEVSMKSTLKPLLILSTLIFISSEAAVAASYTTYGLGVGNKLAHGAANTVTGIAEVPKSMLMETEDKGLGYGLTTGLLTGITYGVGRSLAGVADLGTFFVPAKPLVSPGYAWQDFRTQQTRFQPNWK